MRAATYSVVLVGMFLAGCATPEAGPDLTALDASAQQLEVRNLAQPAPGLFTAGQLEEPQMEALAAAGLRWFVSLRLPDEPGSGWEEAAAARLGVHFARLPIDGASGVTDEQAAALDALMAQAGSAPQLLYCGSSNRVGALLALRAHAQGMTAEEALAFGKRAGLTRLEPVVVERLQP